MQGQLSVTRALGDHDLKTYVSPEPYYSSTVLEKQHKFLILACDGTYVLCEGLNCNFCA